MSEYGRMANELTNAIDESFMKDIDYVILPFKTAFRIEELLLVCDYLVTGMENATRLNRERKEDNE